MFATTMWDDGTGQKLVAGGWFTIAGCTQASNVAIWDGSEWSPLGEGTSGPVFSLAVFDAGAGPALFAGGDFDDAGGVRVDNIAMWDGASWTGLNGGITECPDFFCGASVDAMAVYDDGTGPALYVGGRFARAGGDRSASRLARWNGASWSNVGDAFASARLEDRVYGLAVIDAGDGPRLYVGGGFPRIGGVDTPSMIASWDGAAWRAVGDATPISGQVRDFAWFDDGSGSKLFVAGDFSADLPGGRQSTILAWDGAAWSPVGDGVDSARGGAFALLPDGDRLLLGGDFRLRNPDTLDDLAAWDGTSWSAVGPVPRSRGLDLYPVHAMTRMGGAPGDSIAIAGNFEGLDSGQTARNIGVLDGVEWRRLGEGVPDAVRAMAEFGPPGDPAVYAAIDRFDLSGADAIVRLVDGRAVPTGAFADGQVNTMIEFDDGTGAALYVGGAFREIGGVAADGVARWDGSAWAPVGTGLRSSVSELVVVEFLGRSRLIAVGSFSGGGTEPARNLAEWDGTAWVAVGGGLGGRGRAAVVFDDGTRPRLYVAGDFSTVGAGVDRVSADNLARWDGSAWEEVGGGVRGSINSMAVFDDGTGARLVVAGRVSQTGGASVSDGAAWDGSTWESLGTGVTGCPGGCPSGITTIAAFDDGLGPKLYVGGRYLSAGGTSGTSYLAAWDGADWQSVATGGMNDSVSSLLAIDQGRALLVGGDFTTAGDGVASYLAVLESCPACPADLDGDAELTIFDFLKYQNLFQDGDLAADFDGDGELTIFDFLAFQNAFDAGCP